MSGRSAEEEITTRIGTVASAWARFEYRTTQILWHLANVDIHAGACISAQIQSQPNRLRALCALVALRGGDEHPLVGDINAFSVKADKLIRQRNRFVHDPWIYKTSGQPPIRVEVTADRKLRYATVETSLPEMDELVSKIQDAIQELERLYLRIRFELPPWPDTQYQQSLDRDPVQAHIGRNSGD